MEELLLAIDPGNVESGYAFISMSDYRPVEVGKIRNGQLLKMIIERMWMIKACAIEMVASYGMSVGREVFDTCVWIGRFDLAVRQAYDVAPMLVYRLDEKLTICHDSKANDASIKQALVDRFAYGQRNYGKGTKKEPGFFYGFARDMWSAYAVGVTYLDKKKSEAAQ